MPCRPLDVVKLQFQISQSNCPRVMLSIVSHGLVDNLNLQGIGAYKNQILDHVVK